MPSYGELAGVPRRALPIFYVLDTSGSMQGEKIERLNHAMEETVDALKQVAAHNGDAQLKVAVLEFATNVRWVQPAGPEDMEDFIWQDLGCGGMTYMGAALNELESKLHRDQFLSSATGSLMPVIIFMTDGHANDDYLRALEDVKQNKFFQRAVKIGFAIGDDADDKMIAKIVGDREAVIKTDDLGLFARLIQFVSVTSSMAVSRSATAWDTEPTGSSVIREVLEKEGLDGSDVGIPDPAPAPAPVGVDINEVVPTIDIDEVVPTIDIDVKLEDITWDEGDDW